MISAWDSVDSGAILQCADARFGRLTLRHPPCRRCDTTGICASKCSVLVKTYSCAAYYAPGKIYAGWCDKECGYGTCPSAPSPSPPAPVTPSSSPSPSPGVCTGTNYAACSTDGSTNYHYADLVYSKSTGKFTGKLTSNFCPNTHFGLCPLCNPPMSFGNAPGGTGMAYCMAIDVPSSYYSSSGAKARKPPR